MANRFNLWWPLATMWVGASCAQFGTSQPKVANAEAAQGAAAAQGIIGAGRDGAASRYFAANRDKPLRLRAFLQQMPKGGDIHSHLSGAVYAESYLQWAAAEKLCVNPDNGAISGERREPCQQAPELPAALVVKDSALYGQLVDKLSLRNMSHAQRPGHDQFFEAFAKFGGGRKGQMLAEVSNRAATQEIQYVELMVTVGKKQVKQFMQPGEFSGDIAGSYAQLVTAGLPAAVAGAPSELLGFESDAAALMNCNNAAAQPGCAVTRRYLLQVNRTGEPQKVFTEMVVAFETAARDPLAAGVNLVAPEDHLNALRDYDLHMRMIGYLRSKYPGVQVSLHAGELALGLVPTEHLRDHIRKAVEVAGASRIGHGVDVMYENAPFALLGAMRAKQVAVEICLTSNATILGVEGALHPFPEYRAAGVPTLLASDDEGISRIDLTNEFVRATSDYQLSYVDVKQLARNSLQFAFLKGPALWTDARYQDLHPDCLAAATHGFRDAAPVDRACAALLKTSEKAAQQWHLEHRLFKFEAQAW